MENKILTSIKQLTKNHPIEIHQFKVKKKKSSKQIHIKPTFFSYFKRRKNRKYTVIIPVDKIGEISKMSQAEIKNWLKNDVTFVLESQTLPPLKLAGFTLQYLMNKK